MIRAIVTDIEGTTSDIAFVKDVLFPYARAALPGYVNANLFDPAVQRILNEIRNLENNQSLSVQEAIQLLIQWIDEDRKIKPLKDLQGLIWHKGYETGEFKGHVYQDAVEKLSEWNGQGIKLFVYSSGSITAQMMLFGYSTAGDITSLFTEYFDTSIGGKKETESYHNIVRKIGLPAKNILFLSDVIEELDAARAAGMQTRLLNRNGSVHKNNTHQAVQDFASIVIKEEAA